MTRIISILSGKGGVGKTTTVTNLGAALVRQGKNIIILDGNVTTPNLSLHLGIPFYKVTLHDALKKKIPIDLAVYEHESGIKIIPASLSIDAMKDVDLGRMQSVLLGLLGKADIIIVDAAAGLGREAQTAMMIADELIIVTNPELPAVTDALRTIKLAEQNGVKISGVVLNRKKGYKHEMKLSEIKSMLEVPILAVVPEDLNVPRSIAAKSPVVHYKPNSKASKEFKKLANKILGAEFEKEENWMQRFFGWLT